MLKNTLTQARTLFARTARQRRPEPDLAVILTQALNVVDHADRVAREPNQNAHQQALGHEIEALRGLLQARAGSGPSAGLSDALRVLFKPGTGHHPRLVATLSSHIGPQFWAVLSESVVAGDLQALEAVRVRAQQSGQNAAGDAELERAFERLIHHAITPQFIRQVRAVQQELTSLAALSAATERLSVASSTSSWGTKLRVEPRPAESAGGWATQALSALSGVPPLPRDVSEVDALAQKYVRLRVTDGTKETADRHNYQAKAKRHLSHMQWGHDSVVLTQTIVRGGYGKVRFGVQPDGTILADKEYRISKVAAARTGHKKTAASTFASIAEEAVRSVRLRHVIETHLPAAHQAAARMRTSTREFGVRGMVRIARPGGYKLHMLMTFEGVDVFDIMSTLPETATKPLRALALSLAAQGFHELAQLHEHGNFCHLDIKPENFMYNEGGQIKLIDFGLAEPTSSGQSSIHGFRGTMVAPEMFDHEGRPLGSGQPLGSATDVFLMALTVVDVASRFDGVSFSGDHYTGSGGAKRAQALFRDFYQWRNQLPRVNRKLVLHDIGERGDFGRMFAPLAKASPALCELLLECAFNEHPERRWSAERIARTIDKLYDDTQYNQVAETRPVLDRLVQNKTQFTQLRREVEAFERRTRRPRGEDAIR